MPLKSKIEELTECVCIGFEGCSGIRLQLAARFVRETEKTTLEKVKNQNGRNGIIPQLLRRYKTG